MKERYCMPSAQHIEEAGFEALYRLYEVACRDSGQCRIVAGFLLGLYNGRRSPFDLTDLRAIDDALYEDCIQVLHMDARVKRREVHTYFDDGNKKFERLAYTWQIVDRTMLETGSESGVAANPDREHGNGISIHDRDYLNAELATYGHAAGYRDVNVNLHVSTLDGEHTARNVDINLNKDDALALMHHIKEVNEFAWRAGRRPLDAVPEEQKPAWIK
jgi:hypothetical protein